MLSETKRTTIRRRYKALRASTELTQLEIQALARLTKGRYWRIENGYDFPTDAERRALARALKVEPSELPGNPETQPETAAAS